MIVAALKAKVIDGNITASIILCSDEKPTTDVKVTGEKLMKCISEPRANTDFAHSLDDVAVSKIRRSKSCHQFAHFRLVHLVDMTSFVRPLNAERLHGPALLTCLTRFVNSLLEGIYRPIFCLAVTRILFGGQLAALEREDIRQHMMFYSYRLYLAKSHAYDAIVQWHVLENVSGTCKFCHVI